jgi:hypothetical protein
VDIATMTTEVQKQRLDATKTAGLMSTRREKVTTSATVQVEDDALMMITAIAVRRWNRHGHCKLERFRETDSIR